MSSELLIITRLQDSASAGLRALRDEIEGIEGSTGIAGRGFAGLQSVGTVALAAIATAVAAAATAVVAFLASSISYGIEFESAFAGIVKTVDGVADSFGNLTPVGEQLRDEIRQLALTIPVAATELARIGELAGQMGIQADGIIYFTDTIAKLGVTTNLSSDQAAMAIARLMNVMGTSNAQVSNLGSSIVWLGNNFAATESEIVDFASRLAGVGALVGLTEADILGIGAAFSAAGVQAEAGGTAVQKVLMTIQTAVMEGGSKLELFANTAGMTATEFAAAWRDDAGNAFVTFVEGLGAAGEDGIAILNELGLMDQRLVRGFLAVAAAGDLLRTAVEGANFAFADNTALAREAAIRFETVENQMVLFKNVIRDVQIGLYDALRPAIVAVIAQMTIIASTVGPQLVSVMTVIAATIGEFIRNLQSGMPVMDALIAALEGIVPEPVIAALTSLRDNILPVVQNIATAVTSFITWKDVLIGVGIAIASVLLPALAGIIGGLLSFAAPIVGLIVAVAALRTAWENDFLGIRTAVEGAFGPISEAISTFIATLENGGSVLDAFSSALPSLGEAAAGAGALIKQGLVDSLTNLGESIGGALAGVQQSIFTWAGATNWGEVGMAILNGIAAVFMNLGDTMAGLQASLFNAIANAVNGIDWNSVGQTLVQAIATAITAAVGALAAAGTAIVSFFVGFFSNPDIGPAATNLITALANAIAGTAEGIGTGLQAIWTSISNWFQGVDWGAIGQSIMDGIGNAAAAAGIDPEKILEPIRNILGEIERVFAPLFERLREAFSGFGDSMAPVGEKLSSLKESFARLGEAVQPVISVLGTFAGFIGAAFGLALGVIGTVIGVIANLLGNVLAGIINNAGTIIGGLVTVIEGIVDGITNAVTAIVDIVRGIFEGDWAAVWEAAKGFVTGFVDSAETTMLGLVTILDGIMATIWDSVVNTINDLTGASIPSWEELKTGIIEKCSEIDTAIAAKVEEWKASFLNFIDGVRNLNIGESIKTFITEGLTTIAEAIGTKVTEWVGRFTSFTDEVRNANIGQSIVDAIIEGLTNFVTSVGATLSGWITSFVNWVNTTDAALKQIGLDIINKIITGLAEFVSSVGSTLSGWYTAFTTWVAGIDLKQIGLDIVNAIIDGLMEFVSLVGNTLIGWMNAFTNWVNGIDWYQIGYDIVTFIILALTEFPAMALDKLAEWAQVFWDWATGTASDLYDAGVEIVVNIVEGLGEFVDLAWDTMSEWAQTFWDWATETASDLWDAGVEIVTQIVEGLREFPALAWESMTDWAQAFWDWATQTASDLWDAGVEIVTQIVEGLREFPALAWEAMTEWAQTFWDWATETASDLWDAGVEIVTQIVEGLREFPSLAWEALSEWAQTFWDWATDTAADLFDAGVEIVTKVIEGIATFPETVLTTLATWLTAFQNWVSTSIIALQDIGVRIVVQVATGLAKFWENAEATVSGWFTSISTYISGKIEELKSLGSSIVEGIISGITSMAQAVIDAASGVIQGGIQAIRYALGDPHSPAPAIIPLGASIGEGIAFGITSTSGLVVSAISQLASVMEIEGVKAFGEAMQAIAAGIAAAMSAILDIGSFQGGGDGFGAAMQALVDMMAAMVAAIANANTYSVEVLESLGSFAEVAGAISELLVQTSDVVDYIGRWRAPDISGVNASIQTLVGFLGVMVQGIVSLNLESALILAELGDFLSSAAELPGLLMGVADIVSYLAAWQAPSIEPVIANVQLLSALLGVLVTAVAEANTMGLGMLDILSAFIETATGIVGLIAPLADAMFDIANFPPGAEFSIMQRNIDLMAGYLAQIVTAVAGANTMGQISLEQLSTFVGVAGDIVALINPMAEAMFGIANFPQGTDVQVMARNIDLMAGYLRDLVAAIAASNSWGQLTLSLLDTFVQVAGSIAELIVPLADAIWNIANFRSPDLFAFVGNIATLAGHLGTMVVWFYSSLNLSQAALEALGQYIEVMSSIAEGIVSFTDAIAAVAAFQPPDLFTFVGNIATLAGHLGTMVVWFYSSLNLSQAALDALGQYTEVMLGIAEGMVSFIDAIAAIAGFQPPDLFTFVGNIATLAGHLGTMVVWFYSSLNLSQAALEALGQYVEVIGDLVDLIADAIEALGLIAGYSSNTAALGPAIEAFSADLMLLVQTLATAFTSAAAASLSAIVAAGEFTDAIGDILDVVEVGVEALASLAAYVPTANLLGLAQQFATDLALVVTTIVTGLQQAGILASQAVLAAGEASAAIGDIVDMIEPAVEAVVQLVGYTTVGGLQTNAQQFATDLVLVVLTLVDGLRQAGLLANEAVSQAGEMAGAIENLLKVVEPALHPDKGAISLIAKYVSDGGLLGKAQQFINDLIGVTQVLVTGLTTSALAAGVALDKAGEMAESMKKLFDALKPAVDALSDIAAYTSAANLTEKAQSFISDLVAVANVLVSGLVAAAGQLGAEAVSAAHAFAQAISLIASRLLAIVESLSSMGGLAMPNIEPVLNYLAVSAQQILVAFHTAGDIGAAVQYAEMFRANLQQLVAEVQQAVTLLSQIAGSGTSGSVQGALSAIAAALQNTEGQFAGAGTALANALISALTTGVAGGQGAVTGALLALLSVTRSAGEGAGGSFSTVGSAIISAIVGAIQSGQAQVIAAVVAVVNAAVAAGVAAARAADAIGQQVIQAALAELNSGRGQLDSAGVATGTAIIDGMSRAIVAGKSRVVSAILETIRAAIAAAQSALGIASPSKVATRLFRNFMETASRTVDAFSGSLADSVRSAVSGATAAAAAGLPRSGLPLAPAAAIPMPPNNARLSDGLAGSISRARGRGPGGVSTGSTQVVLYGNVVLPGVTDTRSFLEELDALRGGV